MRTLPISLAGSGLCADFRFCPLCFQDFTKNGGGVPQLNHRNALKWLCDLCGHNYAQRVAADAKFNGRATDVFAIGEQLGHGIRLNPDASRLPVLHLRHADVCAAKYHVEQAQQSQLAELAYKADIEQSVVHFSEMGKPHAAAVARTVANRD